MKLTSLFQEGRKRKERNIKNMAKREKKDIPRKRVL
jgi:hypothetical protein